MAFKLKGSPMARNYGPPFKHSTEKVLGKEQPVGKHSHPGEKVVAQGADVNDVKADAEYNKRLQPGEHPDTAITGGSKSEAINDLEDRIEFLRSDIADSPGGAKAATMKKSLARLQAQLSDLQ